MLLRQSEQTLDTFTVRLSFLSQMCRRTCPNKTSLSSLMLLLLCDCVSRILKMGGFDFTTKITLYVHTSSFSALKQEAAATQSLILVYLHSPVHRQAGELCQKFLLNSQFLDWITQNNGTHIIGGVRAMGSSIHTSQGSSLSFQLAVASFPCIALLQPSPSSASSGSNGNGSYNRAEADHKPLKLVFKAEGPALIKMTSSQLLNLIKTTYQRHQIIVQEREARRIEREQEQQLRRQQDAEYQEALRADQERERQRQEEEELQKRVQKEEEENEKKKIQEEKDRLEKAKALVRPEPANVTGRTDTLTHYLNGWSIGILIGGNSLYKGTGLFPTLGTDMSCSRAKVNTVGVQD